MPFHNVLCCKVASSASSHAIQKKIKTPVSEHPSMTLKQMVCHLTNTEKVQGHLKRDSLYRTRKNAVRESHGDFYQEYAKMCDFVKEFNDMNEFSHAWLSTSEDGVFQNIGVCLHPTVTFLEACGLDVMSVDACSSDLKLFGGRIYCMSGIDRYMCKNTSVAIMFSCNKGEQKEDWLTFAREISKTQDFEAMLDSVICFSDRNLGIKHFMIFFPQVTHRYCALHIIRNCHGKGESVTDRELWNVIKAPTRALFDDLMGKFKTKFPITGRYIDNIVS